MNTKGQSELFIYFIIAIALLGLFLLSIEEEPQIPATEPPTIQNGTAWNPVPLVNAINTEPAVWNPRTKYSDCTMNNWPYQDFDCTPGAIFPNATKEVICVSGYSATVRDVPESLKDQVYAEYNIINIPGENEVDHCVNLAIGGSNDISNLWPERYNDTFGARIKDRVENCLHRMVCDGTIDLYQAQYDVCHNWTKYLKENGGIC